MFGKRHQSVPRCMRAAGIMREISWAGDAMRSLIRSIKILLVLLVLGTGIIVAYGYSGLQDVSADAGHLGLTGWWLETVRGQSVARAARGVEVRLPEPMTEALVYEAVTAYEDMCARCHAPPGREPTVLARGLNPNPPDLARAARGHPPEELFWVTRHGIRMTGMPAWGVTHSDDELWRLIALVLRFPEMTGNDYEALLAAARDAGIEHHHGHDHERDHHHQEHDHDVAPGDRPDVINVPDENEHVHDTDWPTGARR
jgi:mono/diheme cytochrome c family protein